MRLVVSRFFEPVLNSFHALLLSVQKRSNLIILIEAATTMQSSLFLLMRVPLTTEPHIEGMHGLSVGPKLNARLFLYKDDGK